MANRHLLHISKLEDFKKWLKNNGWTIEETKGRYEVLRARKYGRKTPLLIYLKTYYIPQKEIKRLSFNDKDACIVRAFLGKKKTNADRIRKMPEEELAKIIVCPYDYVVNLLVKVPCYDGIRRKPVPRIECQKCITDWLKSEVKE